jgi:hypothetical protein
MENAGAVSVRPDGFGGLGNIVYHRIVWSEKTRGNSTMRTVIAMASVLALTGAAWAGGGTPEWRGYGGDEQHNAQAIATAQSLQKIHWTTPVDLKPDYQGGELLIHYASVMLTASNTVLVPVKTGLTGGFRVEAHDGTTGTLIWKRDSGWLVPPHDWTPSFPAHLTAQNALVYAGPGGTVYIRQSPDSANGKTKQVAFYGLGNYKADKSTYDAHVMVDTPITADDAGNIYFGFVVTGSTPANLSSGIARIAADGSGTWISAGNAANDQTMVQVAMNCAPAISRDQTTVYMAVSDGQFGYLVGLDSQTLQPKTRAALTDPVSQQPAYISDDSSASPTIGPDDDVYYGVLEDGDNHGDRGWLLHFDSTLATVKTPGSFGWDDTVSVVPSSIVSSYTGSSSYLLMTKYNSYFNGQNQIAILDPDASQKDRFSPATVMKEVLTKLDPRQVPGGGGARYEWCINSAVVDVTSKEIIANAEDGHAYSWDMTTGKLSQQKKLNGPRGEAYTTTVIGPDGTIYATNDAKLYAIGN